MRAMIFSNTEELDTCGLLNSVFRGNLVISRDEFRENMKEPECSWVLSEDTIRARYRNKFSDIDILEEIEESIRLQEFKNIQK